MLVQIAAVAFAALAIAVVVDTEERSLRHSYSPVLTYHNIEAGAKVDAVVEIVVTTYYDYCVLDPCIFHPLFLVHLVSTHL